MSDTVIKVHNLSKRYRIGAIQGYKTFREAIIDAASAPFRLLRRFLTSTSTMSHQPSANNYIWALKDVSFEVKKGEVVGIIGRNGAGKTTLLKILTRITEPTEGYAEIRGRVGSLLEVGTGFHPELTGRENIFLNGAILGMKRAEIKKKFDEIVAFAEIEKFIDTPVKRYSSGMYVRLAFAVAAHLEPEILLVDEVLAVGDAAFQKKCLGKMGDVAKEGRTVLFVSHNMGAIQQLCQRGFVLDKGRICFIGAINDAINKYISRLEVKASSDLAKRKDRRGNQWLKFTKVTIYDRDGNELQQIMSGQDLYIRLYYKSKIKKRNALVLVAFNVKNSYGHLLANLNSRDTGQGRMDIYHEGYFECRWPNFNLRSGVYYCTAFCSVNGEIADWVQDAFIINVEDGDFYKTGKLIERAQGEILIKHSWACGQLPQSLATRGGNSFGVTYDKE